MDGVERTSDGIGADPSYSGNPNRRPTDRSERTAQRTLRLVGFCLVISMCLNVVLVVTLYTLFPMVRVVPALVQFSDKQFYDIQPMYAGTTAERKAREAFARRYVFNRETINLVDDGERWEWIRANSHPTVWAPFIKRMKEDQVWARMERDGLTQEVKILASWSLVDDPARWQVEYERIQRRGYEVVDKSSWVSTFYLGRIDGAASDAQLFDNPFRLRVDRYSINSKEAVQEGGQK